jgi:hypothetical protein
MFTNILTKGIVSIIQTILKDQNIQQNKIKQMINIINIILWHNYLNFNNDGYQQEEGIAMCAPFSAILSEIYFAIPGV